jgi:hypothetical protein
VADATNAGSVSAVPSGSAGEPTPTTTDDTKPVADVGCVMRLKVDVIVAGKDREECERALSVRGPHLFREVVFELVRDGRNGWVNPAWRITEADGQLTVEPKRRRKGGNRD